MIVQVLPLYFSIINSMSSNEGYNYTHICYKSGFELEPVGEVDCEDSGDSRSGGGGRDATWIWGRASGVPSNSAQPPRRPISTTRSNIRANSSFLRFSSSHLSSNPTENTSSLEDNSCTRDDRSWSWSSTSSRLRDWLLDERHDSPRMMRAATPNRKPSARAFAPFSIALASERGRRCCLAGSPRRFVRILTSVLYMLWARFTQIDRNVSCCLAWFLRELLIGFARVSRKCFSFI